MSTLYGLVLAFILQFVAAALAISLTRVTRYNFSWILISLALILMAARRLFEIIPYFVPDYTRDMTTLNTWLGIVISLLVTVSIIFIKKIFKSITEAERIRKVSEMRVLNAIIQTEERERRRFAKDLHDGLGPILSSVKMSLSAVQRQPRPDKEQKILANTTELVEEALDSLKEISENISPHVLENFGLETSLRSFINKINFAGGIRIDFRSNLGKERLAPGTELVVYRAVSELIGNTLQHAGATSAGLSLDRSGDWLSVSFKDDGMGFDEGRVEKERGPGSGLHNIRSRVASINGRFSIASAPGKGTEAVILVRLKEKDK
jgi:signal transduction histidine kinase